MLLSKTPNCKLYNHWRVILQFVWIITINNHPRQPGRSRTVQGTKAKASTRPWLIGFSVVVCRSWSSSLRGNVSLWSSRGRFCCSSWRSWGRSWPPNSQPPTKRYNTVITLFECVYYKGHNNLRKTSVPNMCMFLTVLSHVFGNGWQDGAGVALVLQFLPTLCKQEPQVNEVKLVI